MSSAMDLDRPLTDRAEQRSSSRNATTLNGQVSSEHERPPRQDRVPAISQRLVYRLSGLSCCQSCCSEGGRGEGRRQGHRNNDEDATAEDNLQVLDYNLQALASCSQASPLVLAPMIQSSPHAPTVETVLADYIAACRFYGTAPNAGILTSLRFALPCWRTSDHFHDTDMLALSEVLLRHCNGPLRYVKRLDFSVSGKQVPKEGGGARGFKSHGAVALAKVLQVSQYIVEVRLPRNSVGPYGASAIFLACVHNPALRSLGMRRCRVGERGALVLAETLRVQGQSGGDGTGVLREIDLSANYIGQRGCKRVEQAIRERNDNLADASVQPENLLTVDLEGNLVFPEVMNAVTHGLGLVLAFVGAVAMSRRSAQRSHLHVVSCAVYSISLIVLYTSSTLYHSFFTMQNTKYIFEVVDKCAIYVLIAGSYTPFLQIVLNHEPMWSTGLLSFIWTCGILGILVEAFYPMWRYRKAFSLAMYLGMGWAAIVCLPEAANLLPDNAIRLLVLGGVAYTSGVPFYVRSNNLDHAIWHLFVLAGSIFHWVGIYLYVAVWRIDTTDEDAPRFATCSD